MPKVLNFHDIPNKVLPNSIYVGRPTKWGNPYIIGASKFHMGIPIYNDESQVLSREETIERYKWRLFHTEIGATLRSQIGELRGKDLVCWCAPLPCHADILLKLANEGETEE